MEKRKSKYTTNDAKPYTFTHRHRTKDTMPQSIEQMPRSNKVHLVECL